MTLQQRASDKHAPPGEHAHEQLNSPPSRRCELECSRAFCVLAPDERGRWWPDCPTWPCPDWKAEALGLVGLPDDEQRRVYAARLLEQTAVATEHAYRAGLEARAELWRRSGVQP